MKTKNDKTNNEMLATILHEIFYMKNHMATKDDIKNMATKDDIQNTKDDIKSIRSEMATKDDIKSVRSEMATKDDIKDMATKNDISKLADQVVEYTKAVEEANNDRFSNHERRIKNLENRTFS